MSAGRYDPQIYDLVIPRSFLGDVDWYCARGREAGGPVLELGAGTGRITIPLAEAGVPIWALDADAGMLDALRGKVAALPAEVRSRVTILEGDMRSFAVDQRFALVIAPFRAFLHNVTPDDQLNCARTVFGHLQAGGRFAFNVFHPSLDFMAHHAGPLEGVWRWRATHPLPDGGCLMRLEANRYDTVKRLVHSMHRYEVYDAAGTLTRTVLHPLELAYLYPPDIRSLLKEAGFVDVEISGDFQASPFGRDTDELVVVARRS